MKVLPRHFDIFIWLDCDWQEIIHCLNAVFTKRIKYRNQIVFIIMPVHSGKLYVHVSIHMYYIHTYTFWCIPKRENRCRQFTRHKTLSHSCGIHMNALFLLIFRSLSQSLLLSSLKITVQSNEWLVMKRR